MNGPLSSHSDEVCAFLEDLGLPLDQLLSLNLRIEAGKMVIVTIETKVPDNLLGSFRNLLANYRLVKDHDARG